MARVNKPLGRFALKHPLLFSAQGALIVFAWTAFLFKSPVAGLLWGLGTLIGGLVLWMPKYGPMRNYVERNIDD